MTTMTPTKRSLTKAEVWLRSRKITLKEIADQIGKTKTTVWTAVRGISTFDDSEIRASIVTALRALGHRSVTEKDLW